MPSRTSLSHPRQSVLSRIARCHRAPVPAQPAQAIRFVPYCAMPSRTSLSHPRQSALSRIARCHRAPVPAIPGNPLCPVLRDSIAHQSQSSQAIRFVPYCAMPSRTSLSHPRQSVLSRIARCHRAPVPACAMPSRTSPSQPGLSALSRIARFHRAPVPDSPGYPHCPVLRDSIAHQSQPAQAICNIDILMPMLR